MRNMRSLPTVSCETRSHTLFLRGISLVMIMLFLIGLMPTNTCNAATHTCTYKWVVLEGSEPTSTKNGTMVYRCTVCKKVAPGANSYQTILAHVHDYKLKNEKKPTCTARGTRYFECSKCPMTLTTTLAALGHNYANRIAVAPTCTKTGIEKYQCTRCTAYSNYKTIPALGHNYQWVETVSAGWTSAGCKSYKCIRCGRIDSTSTIPSLLDQFKMSPLYNRYISYNSQNYKNYISSSGSGEEVVNEDGTKTNLYKNCTDGDGDGHEWQLTSSWSSINRSAKYDAKKGPQLNDIKDVTITVLRYNKNQKAALLLAKLSIDAAENNLIGYDQNQRQSYYDQLKTEKVGYLPSNIVVACEDDCAAGVSANVIATGYLLGIKDLSEALELICTQRKNSPKFKLPTTAELESFLTNQNVGFTVLMKKSAPLLQSDLDKLLPGDVVIVRYNQYDYKDNVLGWHGHGHAVVNLTIGKEARATWRP